MEELTKQQIVLVTLLVSFVTSIATGIVTVALMDQAPPGVTQTINRVVERTIEKVTPVPVSANQTASVITKETIVVKEDDRIVKAIEKNTASVVGVFAITTLGGARQEEFLGNGLIVSKEGLVVSDSVVANPILDDAQNPVLHTFEIAFSDGTRIPVAVLATDEKNGFVVLKPIVSEKGKIPAVTPAMFADVGSVKLGQTVVALFGEKISVATGIISNLEVVPSGGEGMVATTTPQKSDVQSIKTDIHFGIKNVGAIIINLSGEVVGIKVSGERESAFLPIYFVSQFLTKVHTTQTSVK